MGSLISNITSNPFNQHPQLVLFPNYSLEKGWLTNRSKIETSELWHEHIILTSYNQRLQLSVAAHQNLSCSLNIFIIIEKFSIHIN
jgi:hypothetical protein